MYPDPTSRSAALYERARRVIPDGVSRGTVLVDPYPITVAAGQGAWVTDVDGRRYLDCNNNYTAIILGHAHPAITSAVAAQLGKGTAFAMATEAELALAELLCGRVDAFDQIRFCNSGTEAVMGAVKAARAFTGRPVIAKFEGSYHGAYDWVETSLDAAPPGWGPAERPAPIAYAAGTPASVAADVVILPYNDAELAGSLIADAGERLAAVVLDPLPSRVGMPPPDRTFLDAVAAATRAAGALLVVDEVITFRLGPSGYHPIVGLQPDLVVLGKIIGGGFPVGAIAGRADVMSVFAAVGGARPRLPAGGTFSANTITMVAGRACLEQLDAEAFERLAAMGERARSGIRASFAELGFDGQVTGEGSLFRLHPHGRTLRGYRDARHSPDEAACMARLHRGLLNRGVAATTYGLGCLSLAMTNADIDHLMDAVHGALAEVLGHPAHTGGRGSHRP